MTRPSRFSISAWSSAMRWRWRSATARSSAAWLSLPPGAPGWGVASGNSSTSGPAASGAPSFSPPWLRCCIWLVLAPSCILVLRFFSRCSLISLMRLMLLVITSRFSERCASTPVSKRPLSVCSVSSRYSRWRSYSSATCTSTSTATSASSALYFCSSPLVPVCSCSGSWMSVATACSSFLSVLVALFCLWIFLRWRMISSCIESSCVRSSPIMTSSDALLLWNCSSSWSMSLICTFMLPISTSRGSIWRLISRIL
mmetsp:Transcript_21330/g.65040  ORF Transcript_21330/g.65040 Transcript_21330/m.65040 type:complete len:256 (+) Transcript_21330:219-986(+)